MKSFLILFTFLLVSINLHAQTTNDDIIIGTNPLKDVINRIGKEVTAVDSVYGGKAFENQTLLNVGGSHPNQLLTVFIDKKDYKNFKGEILTLYLNKRVSIKGKVSEFKGKPQIVVTDPKQIVVNPKEKNGLYVIIN